MPLYLVGARLLEAFPLVPLIGNITIGVGALSYARQFNMTTIADADACPDLTSSSQGCRTRSPSYAGASSRPRGGDRRRRTPSVPH